MTPITSQGITLPELATRTGLSYRHLTDLCKRGLIIGARKHPLSKRWWIYPPGILVRSDGSVKSGGSQE